ncbi:hypothetical protein [Pseudorhizobium halotolerans]|uniref:hypothetical protein n=1 Tax=Pseudorhizobium halotolerans TaxID=1233081 RepID=UPI00115A1D68|nr:hypothetical protein [Pseudorhizobium halotolerans]
MSTTLGWQLFSRFTSEANLRFLLGIASAPFLFGLSSAAALYALPGSDWQLAFATVFLGASVLILSRKSTLAMPPVTLQGILLLGFFLIAFGILGANSWLLPTDGNDALEYMTVARDVFESRSLEHYPALAPETTRSGFFASWTHPPLYVAAMHLANLAQGSADASGLSRLIPVWFLLSATASTLCAALSLGRISAAAAVAALLSVPVLVGGIPGAAIDSLPVAGSALVLAIVAGISGSQLKRGVAVGAALGLALWSHSIAILLLPMAVAVSACWWGPRRWRQAAVEVGASLTLAAIIAGIPYGRNYIAFGTLISDSPLVFTLESLDWSGYFDLSRSVDTWPARIQYGLFKAFSEPDNLGWIFWFAAGGAVIIIWRELRRGFAPTLLAERQPNDGPILASLIFVTVYFAGVVATLAIGSTMMVRNERYLLIITPAAAILAGRVIGYSLLRVRSFRSLSPVRAIVHISVVVAAALATLPALNLWRHQVPSPELLDRDARTALVGSSLYSRPMLWISENLPKDAKILAIRPSHMFHADRRMVSYLDPRLVPFYDARTDDEAVTALKRLDITHVQLPGYYIPPVYKSRLQNFLSDPSETALEYSDQGGNQVYALTPDDVRYGSPVSLDPSDVQWTKQTIYPFFGVNIGRLFGAAEELLAPDGTSITSTPLGLFHKVMFTTLSVDLKPAAKGLRVRISFEGNGFLTVFGRTEQGLFRLGELAVNGRQEFIRRSMHTLPLNGIIVEQRGNSSITIIGGDYASASEAPLP